MFARNDAKTSLMRDEYLHELNSINLIPCRAHATYAGGSSRSRTRRKSPRRCKWWRPSKMRKAQQAALAGRPYASLMNQVLSVVSGQHARTSTIRCSKSRAVKKRELVIVISTDKGLCGALNSNCCARSAKFDPRTHRFMSRSGRKGVAVHRAHEAAIARGIYLKDSPCLLEHGPISKFCVEKCFSKAKWIAWTCSTRISFHADAEAEGAAVPARGPIRALLHVAATDAVATNGGEGRRNFIFEPSAAGGPGRDCCRII